MSDSVQLDAVPLSPEDDRLGIWVHGRSLWYLMCSLRALASAETLHCFLRPRGTRTWQVSGIHWHLGPQNPLAVFLLFSKCSGSRAPVHFNPPAPQADKGQNLTATLRWQTAALPPSPQDPWRSMEKLNTVLNYLILSELSLLLFLAKVPRTAQDKLFVLLISINMD